MNKPIRKAAVIGSGIMGSGIAAHLANVGIPCLLLDVTPALLTAEEAAKGLTLDHPAVRNRLAAAAVAKLKRTNPPRSTMRRSQSALRRVIWTIIWHGSPRSIG